MNNRSNDNNNLNLAYADKKREPTIALINAGRNFLNAIKSKSVAMVTNEALRNVFLGRNMAYVQKILIKGYIEENGGIKGPTSNAINNLSYYYELAVNNGYDVTNEHVQKELAKFILVAVTDGYKEEDVNGTQIGQFQGRWPGGGFPLDMTLIKK